MKNSLEGFKGRFEQVEERISEFENRSLGNYPAGQELELLSSTTEGLGSILGWGNEIPQAAQHGQKRKIGIWKLSGVKDRK